MDTFRSFKTARSNLILEFPGPDQMFGNVVVDLVMQADNQTNRQRTATTGQETGPTLQKLK